MFVTSRDADKRSKALKLGANAALETGARLPRKVDAVIESVGAATWGHSVRSVRPGGTIAICGATTGDQPGAELTRLFFQDIRVQGCTMGSREDFARLLRFVEHADLHPVIDSVVDGLDCAPEAFARMVEPAYHKQVISAHRTPELMAEFAHNARANGLKVIIAGAGGAAHLPGMIAAQTTLPVIGVPVRSHALSGWDSLLSIVQMPGGIPVATTAVGNSGATNAGLLAVQMLSAFEPELADKLEDYRNELKEKVAESNAQLV